MPRKISDKLIKKLTDGDLKELLNHIREDKSLRLEVRTKGDAFVYYRKGKALELKKLSADKKYGNIPEGKLAVTNPSEYFSKIKQAIDNWLDDNKCRAEFDTQQQIATANQNQAGRYIILDMEYALEQNSINPTKRQKRASFDLLGIDKENKRIVLFEVKRGKGALHGKAGVDDHIKDFEALFTGENKDTFLTQLHQDVINIADDKSRLGLINYELPKNLNPVPELVFVFHADAPIEIDFFISTLKNRKPHHIVSNEDYVLK